MTDLREVLAVQPGSFWLADVDPRGTPGLPGKKAVKKDPKGWTAEQVTMLGAEMAAYQERLFASAKDGMTGRRVLLLLQAMDCGGKDGTVRNVIRGMNPVGIKAVSFGPPDDEERQHDFLWRIRRALPPSGHLGIFNRSPRTFAWHRARARRRRPSSRGRAARAAVLRRAAGLACDRYRRAG